MYRWLPRIVAFVLLAFAIGSFIGVPSDIGAMMGWAVSIDQWVINNAAYPGLVILFVTLASVFLVPDIWRLGFWAYEHVTGRHARYLFFRVEIRDPKNLTASLPVWIETKSPVPFENVDPWFSPGENGGNPHPPEGPYWSMRNYKVVWPRLGTGGFMYGISIPAGFYRIEVISTFKGVSHNFVELLKVLEHEGNLIQFFDVWRTAPDKRAKLVYSTSRPVAFAGPMRP